MSLYLRIGDTRCLPYIISSLDDEQRHVLGAMMSRWTWFERDGRLKHRLQSSATTVSDSAIETMKRPFTISEQQYVKFVEAGEVDLIHSTIMAIDSSIYPEKALKHKIFSLIEKLIGNGKKQGVTQLNERRIQPRSATLNFPDNT